MKKYGLIILAAGGSKRLGSPKQLLTYQHNSLLKNMAEIAATIYAANVVVVIGSEKDKMLEELKNFKINIVINEAWSQGMSTSIKIGLAKILEINPLTDACIFMVCDQPFISFPLLKTLISTYETTGKGIVACVYQGTTGTPVLLDKKFFNAINFFLKEEGVKKLIPENINDLATIPFINGEIDIDTQEDYKKLIDAFR